MDIELNLIFDIPNKGRVNALVPIPDRIKKKLFEKSNF
jgi:hypothetical protein